MNKNKTKNENSVNFHLLIYNMSYYRSIICLTINELWFSPPQLHLVTLCSYLQHSGHIEPELRLPPYEYFTGLPVLA